MEHETTPQEESSLVLLDGKGWFSCGGVRASVVTQVTFLMMDSRRMWDDPPIKRSNNPGQLLYIPPPTHTHTRLGGQIS